MEKKLFNNALDYWKKEEEELEKIKNNCLKDLFYIEKREKKVKESLKKLLERKR